MSNNWKLDGKCFTMKEIPILFKKKEECCGCTACYAACPQNAISMYEDEEGFDYPKIDPVRCIKCYKCITVCPIKIADDRGIANIKNTCGE